MNTYSFTKIPVKSKRVLTDGIMSLSKTRRIGLGRQFVEEYQVSPDSRANLYWDSENLTVAISFGRDEGYTVAFVNGDAGYVVANSFFKQIGVDPSEHQGYYQYKVLTADEAGIAPAQGKVFAIRLEGSEKN